MNSDEIRVVLEQHKLWLNNEGGEEADLRRANLKGANLRRADLQRADLQKADLQEAYLRRADLQGADLQEADLRGVDLQEVDLREANLREANLRRAYLQGADLQRANLDGADLQGAGLRRANLHGANLQGADLRGAYLDFSSFPLWCGGARFKCDPKLVYQLLAHICTLEFDDTEGIKELILPFAKKSHRAKDLGLVDQKATPIKKVRGEDGAALNLAEEALLLFEELKEDEIRNGG